MDKVSNDTRGAFLDPLEILFIDGIKWSLLIGFDYRDDRNNYTISVPAGFVTDFASIPRAFWTILPPTGPMYGKAAVVHDYLYQNGGLGKYTRAQCDLVFRDAMAVLGVSGIKRQTMYLAVRLFGGGAFRGK